jgi:hypothetical protein
MKEDLVAQEKLIEVIAVFGVGPDIVPSFDGITFEKRHDDR